MPRPVLSDAAVEAMRDRLAEAALRIYRADGLEAVTFRRLADATGISHTLPYRYFADKDALLARVRVTCVREFEVFIRAREKVGRSAPVRVRSVAQAYIAYARQRPADYRLIFSTDQPPPDRYPELLAARRSFFEHAVAMLAEFVERGELAGDARLLAHAFWISLHGLMSLHVANQLVHGMRLEALIEPLVGRLLGEPPAKSRRKAA
jgi:AcrR family transcriptional regulator